MEVARPVFAPFEGAIPTRDDRDLHGELSEKLLELVRRKAALLGDACVAVALEGGLTRFGGAG